MDFRQRLEQSRYRPAGSEQAAGPEEPFSCPYFATDKSGSPACLDLRLSGGRRVALPYSYVTQISYDVDKGIEILTSDKSVHIIGRNLSRLYDHLIAYRVRYIQTNIGNDMDEDGLFVKEIRIEEV